MVWSPWMQRSHTSPFPLARLGSAGSRNKSMNAGARFSKHGLSGRPPALTSPAPVAGSRAAGQEQRHASVPTCAEIRAGSGSWQCCPAWQGSRGPDLSGFKNRTGTGRTFVFSSGAGMGPSGCSWDVTASRLPRGGGGWNHAPKPRVQRAASLHPCTVPIWSFGGRAQSSPHPLLQPGWLGVLPWGHWRGRVALTKGQPSAGNPAGPVSPGEVREFVLLLDAKRDSCPRWCRALN